jgi:hypothetical protein
MGRKAAPNKKILNMVAKGSQADFEEAIALEVGSFFHEKNAREGARRIECVSGRAYPGTVVDEVQFLVQGCTADA